MVIQVAGFVECGVSEYAIAIDLDQHTGCVDMRDSNHAANLGQLTLRISGTMFGTPIGLLTRVQNRNKGPCLDSDG